MLTREDKIRLNRAKRYCKKHYSDYPCGECKRKGECYKVCEPWKKWFRRAYYQEVKEILESLDSLKKKDLPRWRIKEILLDCLEAVKYKKHRRRSKEEIEADKDKDAQERASEFINALTSALINDDPAGEIDDDFDYDDESFDFEDYDESIDDEDDEEDASDEDVGDEYGDEN